MRWLNCWHSGVNALAGDHHQAGGAEVRAVHQGAAREALYQPVMHGVEVARILPDRLSSPAGLLIIRVFVLIQEGDLFATRRRDKGIDNGVKKEWLAIVPHFAHRHDAGAQSALAAASFITHTYRKGMACTGNALHCALQNLC